MNRCDKFLFFLAASLIASLVLITLVGYTASYSLEYENLRVFRENVVSDNCTVSEYSDSYITVNHTSGTGVAVFADQFKLGYMYPCYYTTYDSHHIKMFIPDGYKELTVVICCASFFMILILASVAIAIFYYKVSNVKIETETTETV